MSPFGVRLIETVHATALPVKQPFTDDMRAMVEHMHMLGLVVRKPCAFQTPQGIVIHPELAAKLRQQMARRMDTFFERGMLGAIRP